MHGLGRTTGAVSIVNALPTGVGAAVGVGLTVEATVDLVETPETSRPGIEVDEGSDSPLVRSTARYAVGLLAPGRSLDIAVHVRSEVPARRGLKSSSAVSTAIALAVAAALGKTLSPEAASRISADVSQKVGVSATGAFDDAMAAVTGDCIVADNPARAVLRRESPPDGWAAAIWVPPHDHPSAPAVLAAFREREEEGREAAALALSGDYLAAWTANTQIVESVLGYSYGELREELRRRGALAAGVSGTGPALVAISAPDDREAVASALPQDAGEILRPPFRSPPSARTRP